ncbi:MAG TPA: transglutaminase domain-containing protein [Anaerolineae bacterium]|nr:transglutaminase domain-containing protein [Anaerolineae bacterium]
MIQASQGILPVELIEQLGSMKVASLTGQSSGMPADADALQVSTPFGVASPTDQLSISRVQSAYRAGDAIAGSLMITFTVTNNQSPAIIPQIPTSATVTETIDVMSAVDFSNDPNTIRNVLVVEVLTENATFVTASPVPDRNLSSLGAGGQLAFNLGDIPPLGSVTATLQISIPTTVAGFVDLDTGATAWGTVQGRMVSARARPAKLMPDAINGEPIGDWLKWTVDADKYDKYMLERAAELSQDPIRMFEYVRSLGYESYKGSLRGTRGTLWSEAGNSMDRASLLIAMLRANGIPARYRHGALNKERAQELILSMFPSPTGLIGQVSLSHRRQKSPIPSMTPNYWLRPSTTGGWRLTCGGWRTVKITHRAGAKR